VVADVELSLSVDIRVLVGFLEDGFASCLNCRVWLAFVILQVVDGRLRLLVQVRDRSCRLDLGE